MANKNQTKDAAPANSGGAGAGGAGAETPRRLGRGLSALMGPSAKRPAVNVPIPGPSDRGAATGGPKNAPASGAVQSSQTAAAPAGSPAPTPAMPATNVDDPAGRVREIAVGSIQAGPFQPRRVFDDAQLAELAASMKAVGVVQPVVVRAVGGAGTNTGDGARRYELIAGERRWRAAQLAGMERIPAIITDVSDERAAEWSLVENLQRADLMPLERAEGIRALIARFGLSHQQVAERLGMDRSSVANLIRLTELEEPIRAMLDAGTLSGGHGKALLSAPAGAARLQLATMASSQGWSVRKLEAACHNAAAEQTNREQQVRVEASDRAVARTAALRDLEKQLSEHLGTSVVIRTSGSGKRGSLVLKFYDLDHFDGLMSRIGFSAK